MPTRDEFELQYAPEVEDDDKIVGKIWTRRQTLAFGGLASIASLIGCGGGGGEGGGGGTTGESSPSITTGPSNVTAVVGTSATFTIVATGNGLKYQWYRGTTAITGATGTSYTIGSVTAADTGATLHATAKNSKGTATSNNATLTVSTTAVAPAITTQPTNVTANVGSTAAFTVAASGTNLNYQWYRGSAALAGETHASYTVSAVATGDAGTYHVVIANTTGSVTSDNATLTVKETTPTITTQPTNVTVAAGGTATLTVVAGGTNLTYQWYRNRVAISGATSESYTLANAATSDSGAKFFVRVTNTAGSVTSATVTLTVSTGIDLVVTPTAIEGPFFIDEGLERSDLVSPGSGRSTVAGGYPLTLTFTLYDFDTSTNTGTPQAGAHIDIWHADTIGAYSDEASGQIQSENTQGQTWLRGYQVTDANGQATFRTIHPGWYTGRTPHIHVKVRLYNSSGNVTQTFTTQMFFTEAQNTTALSKAIYAHGTRTVFNSNDNVYSVRQSDGTTVGSDLMLNVNQATSGETATFALAFAIA